jgi:hypothetical protein
MDVLSFQDSFHILQKQTKDTATNKTLVTNQ